MTCGIVITRHKTDYRCDPAEGGVCLARLPGDFPDTLEARAPHQQHQKRRQMNRLRGLSYSIIISTGVARPLPKLSIPIARHTIKHRALTTAVSSLEAYSTPAR